ncbi:caspase-8-like [Ptychodera flava]|uniref:caspase-8-like n=1 Tax=Ptychodera flava TaxID=63121 RepID=UPI00396A748A
MSETGISPFATLLLNLNQNLGQDGHKRMSQLLEGNQISKRDMENLKTPMEIFQKLEEGGFISEKSLTFLKELLTNIDRKPLISEYIEDYERQSSLEEVPLAAKIGPLKILFDELNAKLGVDDERTMRYLLTGRQISKRDMMQLDDPADIFNKLVESGFITVDNLEFLKNLFQTMTRLPLVKIVADFESTQRK